MSLETSSQRLPEEIRKMPDGPEKLARLRQLIEEDYARKRAAINARRAKAGLPPLALEVPEQK